jgi:hypothetical protein
MRFLNMFLASGLGLALIVSHTAFAVETKYGNNWTKYIFRTNVNGDFNKLHGENFRDGFGSPSSPYIYPGCLAETLPVMAVGPGALRAELKFYSSQWLVLSGIRDLARQALFGLSVSWDSENGIRKSQWMTVPSSYLGRSLEQSRTADGKYVYFLEKSGFELPLVTPEYSFDGDAKNVTVSVCNLMDNTSISIQEMILTVSLNEE